MQVVPLSFCRKVFIQSFDMTYIHSVEKSLFIRKDWLLFILQKSLYSLILHDFHSFCRNWIHSQDLVSFNQEKRLNSFTGSGFIHSGEKSLFIHKSWLPFIQQKSLGSLIWHHFHLFSRKVFTHSHELAFIHSAEKSLFIHKSWLSFIQQKRLYSFTRAGFHLCRKNKVRPFTR